MYSRISGRAKRKKTQRAFSLLPVHRFVLYFQLFFAVSRSGLMTLCRTKVEEGYDTRSLFVVACHLRGERVHFATTRGLTREHETGDE